MGQIQPELQAAVPLQHMSIQGCFQTAEYYTSLLITTMFFEVKLFFPLAFANPLLRRWWDDCIWRISIKYDTVFFFFFLPCLVFPSNIQNPFIHSL